MKEKLIEAGGKLWEKSNNSRVYMSADVIGKVFFNISEAAKTDHEKKSLKKAKIWVDLNDNTIHSTVGTVRVLFNQNNIKCSK